METTFFELRTRKDDQGKIYSLFLCDKTKEVLIGESEYIGGVIRKCRLPRDHERVKEILDDAFASATPRTQEYPN